MVIARRLAALVCISVMSCAPAKPEELERPKQVKPRERDVPTAELMSPLFLPRPALQLPDMAPDFHDDLR